LRLGGQMNDVIVQKVRQSTLVRRRSDGQILGMVHLDDAAGKYGIRILWPTARDDDREFWVEEHAIDAIIRVMPTVAQLRAAGAMA
jgi:hypothetical protein